MLSKFLLPIHNQLLLSTVALRIPKTRSYYVPKNQYELPIPNRMKLGYVLSVYWEVIPLFTCTAVAMSILTFMILFSFKNKVDCTYSTHTRECISRTMNLRHPTIHKLFTINQEYPPWHQMQDVLDKMREAEKRALTRAESCNIP